MKNKNQNLYTLLLDVVAEYMVYDEELKEKDTNNVLQDRSKGFSRLYKKVKKFGTKRYIL